MNVRSILHDLRLAVRRLLRNSGFTTVTILTLTLAIGATTAVFTLVDRVLIRPLPYRDANQLVALAHIDKDETQLGISTGLYLLYQKQASSLESIALHSGTDVNLVDEGEARRIRAGAVSPSFFGVLGVNAVIGRTFTEAEGAPGGEAVVVLSDALWRTRFGADPAVIGKTLDINGRHRSIIGVMPADFGFPDRNALLWLPIIVDPSQAPLAAFGPSAIGRLATGSSVESLRAETTGLIARLGELYPEGGSAGFLKEVGLRENMSALKESLVGDVRPTLWALFGTAAMVLLIACANVGNLLLVRADSKQREMAVRLALGAGRSEVVRWFMSESIVLASVGGVLGAILATVALRASVAVIPADIPRLAEVGVDMRILGFTALITLGCAVFFGLVPVMRNHVGDLGSALREGSGRGATASRSRRHLRNGLVMAQMALALVLLVGSGLTFRTFQALQAVQPGYDLNGVLTARLTVPGNEIQGWQETAGFFRQLGERLSARADVTSVGFIDTAPLSGSLGYFTIDVEDHPRQPNELPVLATNARIEVGYLETMRIQLLEGRTLQSGDGAEGTRAIVVSKSFADHWWPDRSALGRRVQMGNEGEEWSTIVGIVADAQYASLQKPAEEIVYWPTTVGSATAPSPTRGMDIVIRTSGSPMSLVPILRQEVAALNRRIPVSNPRLMSDAFDAATARASFTMVLLAGASGIALLLGLIGIYGVVSYVVTQRTREIGLRMALGATGAEVRGMVVKQGVGLAVAGVVIGCVAALALSRIVSSLLFGVSAVDPITYVSVVVTLLVVAVVASWIPAMRAVRIDPAIALRSD